MIRWRLQLARLIASLASSFQSKYEGDTTGKYQISAIFFNLWHFKVNNEVDMNSMVMAKKNEMMSQIAEEKLLQEIRKRPQSEWTKLYIRRAFLITFTFAWICASLYVIIAANTRAKAIIEYSNELTKQYPWLPRQAREVAALAPTLVVQVVNGLSTPLIKRVVALEKWDFEYQRTNNEIGRIWIVRTFNFVIFSLVQFEKAFFRVALVEAVQAATLGADFDCSEDEASMAFLQLTISETIVKPLSLLATGFASLFLKKFLCRKQDWRPPFLESEQIVWLIYYQLNVNMSTILFPHLVILQPFLFAYVFVGYYIFLLYFAKQPVAQTNKENVDIFLYTFVNASLFVWVAALSIMFVVKLPHANYPSLSGETKLCGPIAGGAHFQHQLEEWVNSNGVSRRLYAYTFRMFPFCAGLLIMLLARALRKGNEFKILSQQVNDVIADLQNQEDNLARLVNNKQKKIEVIEAQIEQQKKEREAEEDESRTTFGGGGPFRF